jgi:hypothetical protein
MGELTSILETLSEKLGEIFGVFDLSYFVGGSAFLTSVFFIFNPDIFGIIPQDLPLYVIFVFIVFSYATGLIGAAAARIARRKFFYGGKQMNIDLKKLIMNHNLEGKYSNYIKIGSEDSLRCYLWAQARENKELHFSLKVLVRYWGMSTMYDSISFGLLGWALASCYSNRILFLSECPWSSHLAIVASILILAWVCVSEACKFDRYQQEELVATIAVERNSRKKKAD